jgi:hypothetical protein
VRADDVEGLETDATGGTEDGEAASHAPERT